jgi:nitrogenase molybdenum-iron protein beta chain
MSKVIEQPRNFCTLGSIHTVMGISGAVPIVHSGSECCIRLTKGMSLYNGYQGIGYAGGTLISNTNIHRPSLIYGGEGNLKSLIESTLKVMNGDLYVVFTGCSVELAGDNIQEVVKVFQDEGIPIVFAETAGFKGSAYLGHELVTNAIIEQFVYESLEIVQGRINLWVSQPYLDPFWSGNLDALKLMLESIGLEVNVLFGNNSSVDCWKQISKAELNVLISPWVGLKTMNLLKQRFNTSYLQFSILPIGALESKNFILSIAERLNLDKVKISRFIENKEKAYYFYMERVLELMSKSENFPQEFCVIGDSMYVLAMASFFIKEVGMIPACQYITDNPPHKHRSYILDYLKELKSEAVFVENPADIKGKIVKENEGSKILILGSTWDSSIIDELDGYFVNVSTPVSNRIVLNCNYVGYDGALRLLEDICFSIL